MILLLATKCIPPTLHLCVLPLGHTAALRYTIKPCIAVGGTITGEHGVGIEKINEMCHQFSKSEL